MARSVVRKSGKLGKKRAYQAVSQGSLVKLDGMQDVLDGIAERLGNLEIEVLKDAWINASKPLLRAVRTNITALPVGSSTKEVLQAQVSVAAGPENKPNVLIGMSQKRGVANLPNRFIFNPYWVEFGTVDRATKGGKRTGKIQPTPYFRPAVTAARTQVHEALAREFKELLVEE